MLVRENDGQVSGAVGVTGDTQEGDEEPAAHGIRVEGLKTDERAPSGVEGPLRKLGAQPKAY